MPEQEIPTLINSFPKPLQKDITNIFNNTGVLEATAVHRITQTMNISTAALMLRLVPLAAHYAFAPISHYKVGAVAQGQANTRIKDDLIANLYLGANIEFTGQALIHSIHAEQSAVNAAWLQGESTIQAIAVSAPPCGYCRQFLYETITQDTLKIFLPEQADFTQLQETTLENLLPGAFGPQDLGKQGGIMNPTPASQNRPLNLDPSLKKQAKDPLILRALQAARQSYAPYTGNYAGCSLQLTDGSIISGRYAENAAHNPSLLPLNAAIAALRLSQDLQNVVNTDIGSSIKRAVLVEAPSTSSQRNASLNVLASFAPGLELEYYQTTVAF